MEPDRRLIMVIQGDAETTWTTYYLDAPCEEHGSHTLSKTITEPTSTWSEDVWDWAAGVLVVAADEACACNVSADIPQVIKDVLEETRG